MLRLLGLGLGLRNNLEGGVEGGIIGGEWCIGLFFLLRLTDLRIVYVGRSNIGMIGNHLVIRICRILIVSLMFIGILLAF